MCINVYSNSWNNSPAEDYRLDYVLYRIQLWCHRVKLTISIIIWAFRSTCGFLLVLLSTILVTLNRINIYCTYKGVHLLIVCCCYFVHSESGRRAFVHAKSFLLSVGFFAQHICPPSHQLKSRSHWIKPAAKLHIASSIWMPFSLEEFTGDGRVCLLRLHDPCWLFSSTQFFSNLTEELLCHIAGF